jgi:RNA polymerase primary sigma factor
MATALRNRNVVSRPMDLYFREINETPLLSAAEERELSERIQDGDVEARDHLVRANLRLVVRIARSYRAVGTGLADMVAEGNLGLIHAAEVYDSNMGTRFCTYASYWIKQSIKNSIVSTSKTIRLPLYVNDLMTKWHRAEQDLRDDLRRAPTVEEIGAHLKLSPKKMAIIRRALRVYNTQPQTGNLTEGPSAEQNTVDDAALTPDSHMMGQEDLAQVLHLVDKLTPREATVLRLRFGLTDEEPCTLTEIGARLGLTRERVRQIESAALATLAERLAS